MTRGLLVGTVGTGILYLLRTMQDREDPWWEVKESKDLEKTTFYLADIIEDKEGKTEIVLDLTGTKLEPKGSGAYYCPELQQAEIPQEMKHVSHEEATSGNHKSLQRDQPLPQQNSGQQEPQA